MRSASWQAQLAAAGIGMNSLGIMLSYKIGVESFEDGQSILRIVQSEAIASKR